MIFISASSCRIMRIRTFFSCHLICAEGSSSDKQGENQERYGDRLAVSMLRRFRTKIVCQQNLGGGTVQFSEHIIGKRTVEVEETTTTLTKTPQGITTAQTKATARKEVPIIRAERLAFELGVVGNIVKAIVVGIGDPGVLTWPVTIWRRRR